MGDHVLGALLIRGVVGGHATHLAALASAQQTLAVLLEPEAVAEVGGVVMANALPEGFGVVGVDQVAELIDHHVIHDAVRRRGSRTCLRQSGLPHLQMIWALSP